MSKKKFICLNRLSAHSFDAWFWSSSHDAYYRECTLLGCSFSETAKILVPLGETLFVEQKENCAHHWSTWRTTATQDGLYIPPWRYLRECSMCKTKQMAEQLIKEME